MRIRILASVAVVLGVAALAAFTVRGAARMDLCCVENHACCAGDDSCCQKDTRTSLSDKQWFIAKFDETVRVNGRYIAGPVLIVHDMKKMADGQPCTSIYRFDPAYGPKEELVSFHCIPKRANRVATTTFKTIVTEPGVKTLVEYQIAGDDEVHGVPR